MTATTASINSRPLRISQTADETASVVKLPMSNTEPPENEANADLLWNDDDPPAVNYDKLGVQLAESGDLFRRPQYGDGLVLLLPDNKPFNINKGVELAPVIADRVRVRILKDGKPKGGQIAAAHLNAMLKSNAFLDHFLTVDHVIRQPVYLPDFTLSKVGYNDGGLGHRVLYVGTTPPTSDSLTFIDSFLDVMAFEDNADRTNTVAALLTVMLRNHWPGGKPILVVTATKSHAGKDTVILLTAVATKQCSISYQATNWALERSFVGTLNHDPEIGVVVVENARLDRRDQHISSAFIERFATDPEPLLFSTGTGQPVRRQNDIVVAISTNFGTVSEDIMNRALPIHLNPVGNVADRQSPIGNPKLEFIPAHREDIAAEARGMIERWKSTGSPLDEDVRHPFSMWAKTVGGILKVNGFTDFLANYGQRKTADDPLREGLGILGAACHGEWKRADDWSHEIAELGLTKRVIPPGDQDSNSGRCRGAGVVLSAHRDETFIAETEQDRLTLQLQRKRARHDGEQPHNRYRFVVTKKEPLTGGEDG